MRKNNKGFTLVELLATIAIVSLVLGIGGSLVFSIMKNSKDTTSVLTEDSAKKAANAFVLEDKDVVWNTNSEDGTNYACISVGMLIDKGYVDEGRLGNLTVDSTIKVVKENGNIVSEELVSEDDNTCPKTIKVDIPKSSDVCKNDLVFAGYVDGNSKLQILTKNNEDINYINDGYSYYLGDQTGGNAGDYKVKVSLNGKNEETNTIYIWSDDTFLDKEVICTIKKAIPKFYFEEDFTNLSKITTINAPLSDVKLISDDVGGNISLKSSNTEHVTTVDSKLEIAALGSAIVKMNLLATRETPTYVTATLIPNDSNYSTKSVVHKLQAITDKTLITKPTASNVCVSGLVYNGSKQKLVNISSEAGYKVKNGVVYEVTNAGNYDVTLVLKDGYVWENGTDDPVKITCSIAKRTPTILLRKSTSSDYSTHIGSVMKTYGTNVDLIMGVYQKENGNVNIPGKIEVVSNDNTTVQLGYRSSYDASKNSHYNATITGNEVGTKNKIVLKFIPTDGDNNEVITKTFTLTVTTNEAKLTYNATKNGGVNCSSSTKIIYYGQKYGSLCTPTKDGYEFIGWYTAYNNRDTQVTADTSLNELKDVTIYAHFRKRVVITCYEFNGTTRESYERAAYMYNNDASVDIKLLTPKTYKNTNECGTWTTLGWSSGRDATADVNYESGGTYAFSNSMNLYARYEYRTRFIYDYNGGDYITSRYEWMNRNASSSTAKDNMGPWTEVVSISATRSGKTFIGWYMNGSLWLSASDLKKGKTKSYQFYCDDVMISAQWR